MPRVSPHRRRYYFTIHFLQSHLPYSWINKQLKPLAMQVKSHKAISEKLQPACSIALHTEQSVHRITDWSIYIHTYVGIEYIYLYLSIYLYKYICIYLRHCRGEYHGPEKLVHVVKKLTNHIQNASTRADWAAGRIGSHTARSQLSHWRQVKMWWRGCKHLPFHICAICIGRWTNRMHNCDSFEWQNNAIDFLIQQKTRQTVCTLLYLSVSVNV